MNADFGMRTFSANMGSPLKDVRGKRLDGHSRTSGYLPILLSLPVAIRFFMTAFRYESLTVGDNYRLRQALAAEQLSLSNCVLFGRMRPLTYCDIAARSSLKLLDSNVVNALIFTCGVGSAALLGFKIVNQLCGQRVFSQRQSFVLFATTTFIAFSPVWSYSITSDYRVMELAGTSFFLASLYFQLLAASEGRNTALLLAVFSGIVATAWHERFIVSLFSITVLSIVVPKLTAERSRRTFFWVTPVAAILGFLTLRFLSSSAAVVGFGGESATQWRSVASTTSVARFIFTLALFGSPSHLDNYYFVGTRETLLGAAPYALAGCCACVVAGWQVIRRTNEAKFRLGRQASSILILILNLGALAVVTATVEERIELRWVAAPTVLALALCGAALLQRVQRCSKTLLLCGAVAMVSYTGAMTSLEPRLQVPYEIAEGLRVAYSATGVSANLPICSSSSIDPQYLNWVFGYGEIARITLVESESCFMISSP